MRFGAASHGEWLEAVEFVSQLLALLPGEELLQRHRSAQGDVHGRNLDQLSTIVS